MQPQSVAVPFQDLDAVTALVKENKEAAFKYVFFELIAHDRKETIVRFTEIDRLAAKEDPGGCR